MLPPAMKLREKLDREELGKSDREELGKSVQSVGQPHIAARTVPQDTNGSFQLVQTLRCIAGPQKRFISGLKLRQLCRRINEIPQLSPRLEFSKQGCGIRQMPEPLLGRIVVAVSLPEARGPTDLASPFLLAFSRTTETLVAPPAELIWRSFA